MSEFEDRLTTALRSAGGHAPEAPDLASAARRRSRARRRRTALASVAAVVAVGGVVGGAALLGNRDAGGGPSVTDDPSPTSSPSTVPAPTSRVESWRDMQVTVPASWGHGVLDDWCANGGRLGDPVVERAGGVSYDILCSPTLGYGVQFFDGSAADFINPPGEVWQYERGDTAYYPDGAWLGYQTGDGDNVVMVVTPDRATTEQVLASFVRTEGMDANGCTPRLADPVAAIEAGTLRLCRYDIDDRLEQSELLTGRDAADAVAALEAAPAKGDRMCTMALTGPVVMVRSGAAQGRVTLDACHGFSWDGVEHDLTADVLYWMLSPGWSGGVEGDVPMPDEFRQ
jgi:hypothetical protein